MGGGALVGDGWVTVLWWVVGGWRCSGGRWVGDGALVGGGWVAVLWWVVGG